MFRLIKKYIFSISAAAVIFYLSTAPPSAFPSFVPPIPHLDKVVHIIMYMILATALSWEAGTPKRKTYYFVVIALPILYGGALELVQQYFFPPRTGDYWDFLADAVGVLLGYFVLNYGFSNYIKNKWKN